MNKIYFYEKADGEIPVEAFIKSLPVKHRAKVFWSIELLQEFGKGLKEPHVKPIKGKEYHGLWELRIQFAGDISRILYFMPSDSGFVLLHGFIKKTDKTPVSEIETAKARMNDFKRRFLK